MRNKSILGLGMAVMMSAAGLVQADYTLSPQVVGPTTVNQGDPLAVDLVLSSDAPEGEDFNFAAIFRVEFSKPGLEYTGYAWYSPYVTNGPDDNSVPDTFPTTLTASSYPSTPAVDAYFENFLSSEEFTTGPLVRMNLVVPQDFELGEFTITAVPQTFDDGQRDVPTTGTSTTVTVVPEPATLGLLGLAGLTCLRRRTR